ncbi:MAG: MFS transporter [Alphaproteobacteria bacterium]|nr:MFS transporter [Alphaproteobacteria bacterium]
MSASPSILRPFAVRSFRFQWPADLATSWAAEMEAIILGWFVLVETQSVLALALYGALRMLGTLLAPAFAMAGDRLGYRNLLCVMRGTYLVCAAAIATLALTGNATPTAVLAVALVGGLVQPNDIAMRNLLVGQTMPPALLTPAMGIARTTMDSARIAGAVAGAGLVAAMGMGAAYLAVSAFYLVSVLLILGADASRARIVAADVKPWADLREGLVHIWTEPHLRAAILIAFLVNLTAYPLSGSLLAHVARDIYGLDQRGLGWLVAAWATGALAGSLLLSTVLASAGPARLTLFWGVVWFGLNAAFALTTDWRIGAPLLAMCGLAQSLCVIPIAVMLLRTTSSVYRARVMGVRMLAVYGFPLGLLAAGPLVQAWGFAATGAIYSAAGLAALIAIGVRWRATLWNAGAPANRV